LPPGAPLHPSAQLSVKPSRCEITQEPVDDEQDAYHQSRALASVAGWLNNKVVGELIKRERAKLRVVPSQDDEEAELEGCSNKERALAHLLLLWIPHYRYDRSRLPRLDPSPKPGLPSAIAAAKAIVRMIAIGCDAEAGGDDDGAA
jgi:hypothetical protein